MRNERKLCAATKGHSVLREGKGDHFEVMWMRFIRFEENLWSLQTILPQPPPRPTMLSLTSSNMLLTQ